MGSGRETDASPGKENMRDTETSRRGSNALREASLSFRRAYTAKNDLAGVQPTGIYIIIDEYVYGEGVRKR
jgi:hypothetical protein